MTTEPNTKNILDKYAQYVSEGRLARLEKLGLKIVESRREGSKIFDADGKAYYDCFCSGGQFVLGHRRPEIVDAFRAALKQFDLGNFILMSEQKASLAALIAGITPGNLKCTVYGVSRGESNDFAMKLSRGFTGRKDIICLEGASHGQTAFALSASDDKRQEELFGPLIPMVKRVPPDAAAITHAVTDETAAVIIEPIRSDAGVLMPPDGLLEAARRACDRRGAVLIFDEGQLAFGRTGRLFESERVGVAPDILTVSKGMGGTLYPISATIFTSRLNRFMITHPLVHLSTFGGADIGCVVAKAAIELIRREKLWENAAEQGKRLLNGLKDIAADCGKLKTVRGIGLVVGLETADAETAAAFTARLAANGVIAPPAPGNHSVVRFTPPIDITADEIDDILNAADDAAKNL